MSRRRNSGYMLQPRSAEITRQRAATVEVLFPAVSQPSLYTRVKERLSTLWTHLFSPADSRPPTTPPENSEKRPSPQKRQNEDHSPAEPKRFKPNPPINRYSCASLSQDESVDESRMPPPAHFTPVLTRSNPRTRPLREEPTAEICPPNPRLQKIAPLSSTDHPLDAAVIKEEFVQQTNRLLEEAVREVEAKQVQKSKTPTPRRDEILPPRATPKSQVVLVVQEPRLIDQRPEPKSEPKPTLPDSGVKAVGNEALEQKGKRDSPQSEPKPEVRSEEKVTEATVPARLVPVVIAPVTVSPTSFVLPPTEFKEIPPESPGFASSTSQSEKSGSEPPAKPDEIETSELSPIKDLCDKPEEPKPVVVVPEPRPVFPRLQVKANPFAEPPAANNPFLMPAVSDRPASFVFGQSNSFVPPPQPATQATIPNPFLSAPVPVATAPWAPQHTHEDAEMKAETPKTMNFSNFPQPAFPPQIVPQPAFPQPAFPQVSMPAYQPLGGFQNSFGQSAAPPPPAAGNFSIGNVSSRRIYRAKRPGQ